MDSAVAVPPDCTTAANPLTFTAGAVTEELRRLDELVHVLHADDTKTAEDRVMDDVGAGREPVCVRTAWMGPPTR